MADIAVITTKIYALLKQLAEEDRPKAISAAMMMLGTVYAPEAPEAVQPSQSSTPQQPHGTHPEKMTAKAFFDIKDPQSKIEELAVAARYREQHDNEESHSKHQFRETFRAARRNFDLPNFDRNMGNAKTARLFNLGRGNALSYYGQEYVDALPDREQIKALKKGDRGKGGRRRLARARKQ